MSGRNRNHNAIASQWRREDRPGQRTVPDCACLGYYDPEFEECASQCSERELCRAATRSEHRDDFRKLPLSSEEMVESAIKRAVEQFGGER